VNIFGCVQCKHISIFLVTFPNKHSFGIGLSTRASRLLHKCRENDTICVLKVAKLVLLWLLFGINDFVTSCASGGSRSRTAACFIIKGNVWWKRTFLPMATIFALHHKHMKLVKPFTPHVIACSIKNVFDQSICRTKERKARLQFLASC